MKKIVFLLLALLCLPIGLMAQSNDDDLYFVPSKDKEESTPMKKETVRVESQTNVYVTPKTTVVYQDRKGNARDVDEYNRRYDARDNDFVMEDDTLYVQEKEQSDLDGEWVSGEFSGSQDDYEYAERIIRFRNPRYAVSISSPYYWDIVYGGNSWDWNVYSDGLYAYAFPTFSNPMWWDWRYNSWGRGWGWSSPYYSSWGYNPYHWGGYYGGYHGGYHGGWGHHHGGWYPGGGHGSHWAGTNTYYNSRRSTGRSDVANSSRRSSLRTEGYRSSNGSTTRRGVSDLRSNGNSTSRRVVGTRSSSERLGSSERLESSSSRRGSAYTRPSSTRSSSYSESGSTRRSSSTVNPTQRSSTYNRGSSDSPLRSYSTESSRRSSSNYNSSSSSRSSAPSSSSSRSSYSSGSSSRSSSYSGGGGSSSRSSGGGGGSSRSSRR